MKFLSLLRGLNGQGTGVQIASQKSPLSEAACFTREPPSTQRVKCVSASVISVWTPNPVMQFRLMPPDVLNRLSDHTSLKQTIHVLKYIFPRQFGLHNVFTCKTDFRETSQPFKDYTLREQEIARDKLRKASRKGRRDSKLGDFGEAIPKRLRGQTVDLVRCLRVLHHRCSYVELLRYYCPALHGEFHQTIEHGNRRRSSPTHRDVENSDIVTSGTTLGSRRSLTSTDSGLQQVCFTDMATPEHQVEAFCRAVMKKVVPKRLWGEGETQAHNSHVFLAQVGRFVRLRRFETLTLHEVMQDMKVRTCPASPRS